MAFEEEFDLEIPRRGRAEKITTVGDAISYIREPVGGPLIASMPWTSVAS